jgi:hypothetical protein
MKRVTLGLAMGLLSSLAAAQQVWRCEQDGQVIYTDQPCEKLGRPLPTRDLKANVADGLASEAARAASSVAASDPASAPPAGSAPEAAVVPASAASSTAVIQSARLQEPPAGGRRARRGRHATQVAMMGLMGTDFVQRGYVPRRQNPASTTNP